MIPNLIVGGGPAGLAIAKELADRGEESLIISENVGGLTGSFGEDGFLFDYGGHVYTTADASTRNLLSQVDAKLHPVRKAFFDFGKRIPFPVQDYTDIPIESLEVESIRNFSDYSRSIFGEEFHRYFLRPFNKRVWTVDTPFLDYDWVYGRVKRPTEKKENWGMNAAFLYAPGHTIVSHMLKTVFATGAVGILQGLVEYVDGQFIWQRPLAARRVFDTTGISRKASVLTNLVACIGLGFNERPIPEYDFHWAYPAFSSAVHRITRQSDYFPGMTPTPEHHSLLMEVPFPNQKDGIIYGRLKEMQSQNDLVAMTDMLEGAVGHSVQTPISGTMRIIKGYPIPTIGHRTQTAAEKERLAERDIWLAGRWGSHAYFNLQHILEDAKVVVATALGETDDIHNYLYSNFYYQQRRFA